jgi:predicted glycoside hydrolase/deacetylase ChbG (UPF0249 family)
MQSLLRFLIVALLPIVTNAQPNAPKADLVEILIRCDDIGMCHAVNTAIKEVLDTGLPISASVMFTCPWYQEAVQILKAYKNVSVGIHLTLNAEWANSLVDSAGFFFPSRAALFANNPTLEDIESELRAQIERALQTGLPIDYLDYHMSAAMQTLATREIVEKLAHEYNLGISRYFGEEDLEGWYGSPIAGKKDTVLQRLRRAEPGTTRLFVFHVGLDTPEMSALVDLNPFGPKEMSRNREAEFRALTSPEFRSLLNDRNITLKTYSDLVKENGLKGMQRPTQR